MVAAGVLMLCWFDLTKHFCCWRPHKTLCVSAWPQTTLYLLYHHLCKFVFIFVTLYSLRFIQVLQEANPFRTIDVFFNESDEGFFVSMARFLIVLFSLECLWSLAYGHESLHSYRPQILWFSCGWNSLQQETACEELLMSAAFVVGDYWTDCLFLSTNTG